MPYLKISPKIKCKIFACGLDKLQWTDVLKLIRDTFTYSGIQIQIIPRKVLDPTRLNTSLTGKNYAEHEIEKYTNELTREEDKPETDFTRDSKSCQPPCTERFPILRWKQLNGNLFNYYRHYHPQDIKKLIKQFSFRYIDLTEGELVSLFEMIRSSGDVYSQRKFDIGRTSQKFHVTLKPNSELTK